MIETIGIIGAGTMGNGIAQVCAAAGLKVTMADISEAAIARGLSVVASSLERLVNKQKMTDADRQAALARITTVTDNGKLSGCDLVIEAATEREDLKIKILKDICATLQPRALLATNTSSISITKLGGVTKRPDRVIGMHFMNPVPLMKLVEVVRGLATSNETYESTIGLAQKFGKTTIAARDIPGFIVNRVLIPLLNEACYALYEGLGSAVDIDTGIKLGLNHPMGPLELTDLIGLDTCLAIAEVLHNELGDDKYRPCPLLRQYVAAGWLGRKVGRGFYKY
jgi:3-hydroxybutyryl-CoA dehydrogenase